MLPSVGFSVNTAGAAAGCWQRVGLGVGYSQAPLAARAPPGPPETRQRRQWGRASTGIRPCPGQGVPPRTRPSSTGSPVLCLGVRSAPTLGPAAPRSPGEPWKTRRGRCHPAPWTGAAPCGELRCWVAPGALRTCPVGPTCPGTPGRPGGPRGPGTPLSPCSPLAPLRPCREQRQPLGAGVSWCGCTQHPSPRCSHLSARGSCITFVSLTRGKAVTGMLPICMPPNDALEPGRGSHWVVWGAHRYHAGTCRGSGPYLSPVLSRCPIFSLGTQAASQCPT